MSVALQAGDRVSLTESACRTLGLPGTDRVVLEVREDTGGVAIKGDDGWAESAVHDPEEFELVERAVAS